MGQIPADIMKTALDLCRTREFAEDTQMAVARAILAERQSFAVTAWDFFYGEKRGHMTPEDFAGFLQGPAPKFAVTSPPTTEE